jgi:hypothetical protein
LGSAAKSAADILVIGRQADTAIAKDWAGHTIIDMPNWTPAANAAIIENAIANRQVVYLASPMTAENLFNAVKNRAPGYGTEIQQFLAAGYTKVGDYLHPPGGP